MAPDERSEIRDRLHLGPAFCRIVTTSGPPMLKLLTLPIELLRVALYALRGLVDALRARNRLRFEFTVLINAPREAVWRLSTAERVVLHGPPVVEVLRETVPDSDGLSVTRLAVSGQPRAQVVTRELERDEAKGISLARTVRHALSVPPEGGRDCVTGLTVEATPQGTALTVFNELTVRSFRDRIVYPIGLLRMANLIKQQCEEEAGTHSRLAAIANHGLVLSVVAFLSFWYLLGWQLALLFSIVVVVHEAGHVAGMRMVGVGVRGIYLIPFFGGAVVPKTAYRTEGRLGFIALMGPGLSLIPTLSLAAMFPATGEYHFLQAAWMFAMMNVINLLPIYPLDGGLIFNSLVGSVSRKSALIAGWIGVLAGLGLAIYWQSFLVGIPFLLFGLQRYLAGSRGIELEPLSIAGGTALALASIATFALYVFVLEYAGTARAAQAASRLTAPDEVVLYVHSGLRSTRFLEPLACALRQTLVAPVSTRELDLPLGSELAATSYALDANKVAERFARATAAQGSERTFKYLLLGDDLRLGRRDVYGMILGDEMRPDHAGLLSTARLEEVNSGPQQDPNAEVMAQRAYKLILRMISQAAGYTNPQGCVLGFHEGSSDEIDGISGAFCEWDRTVLAAARIIRTQAGSGCPHAAQTEAASSSSAKQAHR
jgi:Zn-dependent protease